MAEGRLHQVRRDREQTAVANQEDLRRESAPQLGDDPARHQSRRCRHHRPRSISRAAQQGEREVGAQGDDARIPDQGLRRGAEEVSGLQHLARRRQPDLQAVLQHRLRRRHAQRPGRAGDQERRSERRAGHRQGNERTLRQGARRQARAGRHAGRMLFDLEPRRHRRHVLHADHQRAGSRDPRRLPFEHAPGVGRQAIRRRG